MYDLKFLPSTHVFLLTFFKNFFVDVHPCLTPMSSTTGTPVLPSPYVRTCPFSLDPHPPSLRTSFMDYPLLKSWQRTRKSDLAAGQNGGVCSCSQATRTSVPTANVRPLQKPHPYPASTTILDGLSLGLPKNLTLKLQPVPLTLTDRKLTIAKHPNWLQTL